jgi:LysR family transcriptional regulator, carnitine catabolism transcriptional activator
MVSLNLRRIQTFVAVAESRSFRVAGELLHRSPSVVSAHVSQLEEELGVALFNRTTRKVTTTEAGQRLLARCKSALSDLDSAVREIHEETQLRRGRVAIGSTPAMMGSRLPPILAAFQRRYPGVLLTLKEDFAERVYAGLASGEIDFAIGPRLEGFGDVGFMTLVRSPFVLVVPKKFARGDTITLRDAMKYPQLALPNETNTRRTLEGIFMRHGSAYAPNWEATQLQTLFALVEAGFGVTIIPGLAVPAARGRAYRVLTIVDPALSQEVCLVTARGKRLSTAARTCCDLVLHSLRDSG